MPSTFVYRCARCRKQTDCTSMSHFNTEIICMDCEDLERKHPKYAEAVAMDEKAIRAGDFNFPGIGLPIDL